MLKLAVVLEERRIARGASRGRKVRTPQSTMPRNSGSAGDTRGRRRRESSRRTVPQRRYRLGCGNTVGVRVKRWGKSPPREAQATRHGKPHRVQGQIGNRGAARSASAKADRFRVSAAKTNDSLRSQERRQKSAYSSSRTNFNSRRKTHSPAGARGRIPARR